MSRAGPEKGSESGAVPRVELADGYSTPRVVIGAWQLSEGHARTPPHRRDVLRAWQRMVDAGLDTFDCADIYTGVEELLGELVRRTGRVVRVHTKYVPDLDALATLRRGDVEATIDRSLRRLGVDRLDLVQFSWWDLTVPGYVDAMLWLDELRQAGKIRHLGATNFDTRSLGEMIDAGAPIVAHQVQYSLLDHRPERGMTELCRRHAIRLLCYGTLAGGLLSERFLGVDEPRSPHANRSMTKYLLMVSEYGGWPRFQSLLSTLASIAAAVDATIANVAVAYTLARPQVGAAIVGGTSDAHLESNLRALRLQLDGATIALLREETGSTGPPGDVFEVEREVDGPHGAIMRRNLNRGPP